MDNTNNIINKIKLLKKELENIKNIDCDTHITNEINILINNFDNTIDNIDNSINNKNSYNKEKLKENIILRIFMPYMIYLSSIINIDEDNAQLLNMDYSFNENFYKEVLKKYVNN